MNPHRPNERRTRQGLTLVLVLVLLAAGIFAAGIFSYRAYERRFRTGIEQGLSAIAELKVAQIAQWRRERLVNANFLRRTPYVARRTLDVLTHPASPATRQMFTAWLESLFAVGPYEQALLLDEHLNVALVCPEGTSGVLSDVALRAAQQALSSRQVVVADLHRETEDGPVYLSLMVPLVVRRESVGDRVPAAGKGSSPEDRSAGLLVLQINAHKQFYPMIQLWPTPSRTAEALLVRRDGKDALFLSELRFRTNTALRLRMSLERTNTPAVKAALGQEGIVDGIDYRGVPVVAALRAIPDSPWWMVARMDLAEVYAPVRERLWLTVLLVGALLLGAGASVGLIWRQQHVQFYKEKAAAAEAIRASEEKYRALFENMAAASCIDEVVYEDGRPVDYRVLDINPAFEKLIGVSRSAAVGALASKLYGPGKPPFFDIYVKVAETGEPAGFEDYFPPIGKYLHVTASCPARGRFSTVFTDITERKRTEEAQALQARIATIFLTLPDDEMFHEVLQVILDVMHSPFGVFGFIDEDGANVVPTMTRQIWDRCQVPEKTIRFPRETWGDSSWCRALREQRTIHSNQPSSNIPEGHVGIDRHISLPILFQGEAIGLFQVANKATDYTEADLRTLEAIARHVAPLLRARLLRERAQQALAALSSRQEALLAAVPDLIMEVDRRKVYTWTNQAGLAFFGDDVIGKEAASYFEGEQPTYQAVQPLFDGSRDLLYVESWQWRKDGVKRLLGWWCRALKDEDGNITGALSSGRDITERKQAEEENRQLNQTLEQRVRDRTAQFETANKELEAFSYSVSHDLRAPLRAIDGFARILEEDCGARLDDEGRRLLGVICGEAKRMGRLIDNLLTFSRMNRQQVSPEPIDMTALARAVFEEHAAQAPGRQLEFKLQPLPPAQGDRAMLRQALANLFSNAIKYTRPRAVAEIEIGGRTEGGENLYYVKDNGVGFDMNYAGKLFGVFQRLHPEDEFEGTGVGLALVQRVIHRHGGRVWAEAKLEEGATFHFTIPTRKNGT